MTKTYHVDIEPLAQQAVLDALSYISEQGGEGVAGKWLTQMLESIDALETFPKAFPIWTHRQGFAIYSKRVQTYRIFYWVNEAHLTVHIIDIVHTARDSKLAPYRDQNRG